MLIAIEAASEWNIHATQEVRLLIQYLENGGTDREAALQHVQNLLQLLDQAQAQRLVRLCMQSRSSPHMPLQ